MIGSNWTSEEVSHSLFTGMQKVLPSQNCVEQGGFATVGATLKDANGSE